MARAYLSAGRLVALLNLVAWGVGFAFYMCPGFIIHLWDLKSVAFIFGCALFGLVSCWAWFGFVIFSRRFGKRGQAAASALALVLVMLFAALVSGAVNKALFQMTVSISGTLRAVPLVLAVTNNWLLFGWVYLVFGGGVAAILSVFAARAHERDLAQAREAAQAAQLAALRLQINPHFLFNALNAVTELITEDRRAEAETMVSRLSDFFRASLTTRPGALVRLDEELDLMGSYLEIERTRFGERLTTDITLPRHLRAALVPPFLLQPLVENAARHAVATSAEPVTISVLAQAQDGRLSVAVQDDGAAGGAPRSGLGVGLSNVAARLRAIYGEDGVLEAGRLDRGFRASVRLPLKFEDEEALAP